MSDALTLSEIQALADSITIDFHVAAFSYLTLGVEEADVRHALRTATAIRYERVISADLAGDTLIITLAGPVTAPYVNGLGR